MLLQLVPYGWEVHPGQLIRSGLSQDIALALGGHYFQVFSHSTSANLGCWLWVDACCQGLLEVWAVRSV